MKSFGTHFKSLTANKFAYKALLEVFNTPHVYRVEIPCGASARCLVGPEKMVQKPWKIRKCQLFFVKHVCMLTDC